MALSYTVAVILILVVNSNANLNVKKYNSPPHCTQVTKDTDYVSQFKFDYPVAYIQPGQREAFQQMFCVNPAAVNKAVTTVCDWAAPPQVQFTLGDDYMHVVRQDPTGKFLGNAVINTYQICSHNIPHKLVNHSNVPVASDINFTVVLNRDVENMPRYHVEMPVDLCTILVDGFHAAPSQLSHPAP